jgi:hypothetical protein
LACLDRDGRGKEAGLSLPEASPVPARMGGIGGLCLLVIIAGRLRLLLL